MGTSISFKRPDGKEANGYLANAAKGDAPGIVVIQEWWGLQDQIKGLCDRFARAGFDALEVVKQSDAEAFAATLARYTVFYQDAGDDRVSAMRRRLARVATPVPREMAR